MRAVPGVPPAVAVGGGRLRRADETSKEPAGGRVVREEPVLRAPAAARVSDRAQVPVAQPQLQRREQGARPTSLLPVRPLRKLPHHRPPQLPRIPQLPPALLRLLLGPPHEQVPPQGAHHRSARLPGDGQRHRGACGEGAEAEELPGEAAGLFLHPLPAGLRRGLPPHVGVDAGGLDSGCAELVSRSGQQGSTAGLASDNWESRFLHSS
mmetsp:Transcript_9024/g.23649  ORF Transcript_9024/g.23649 Transcript_9024/m.23649 type:complete len:209 (+) Transcript_9024:446-1072(+)